MTVNLVVNGSTFTYPQTNDTDWGNQATQWATAVTAGLLPKLGGTFLITAEVSFGTQAGIAALWLRNSNPSGNEASSGFLRLSNTDSITWGLATSGQVSLTVGSDNKLRFNSNSFAYIEIPNQFEAGQAVASSNSFNVSGAVTVNCNTSNNFFFTLNGSITLTVTNPVDGQHIVLAFQQGNNSAGITWPANFAFIGIGTQNPQPNLSTSRISVMTGFYLSNINTWICTFATQ